MKKMVSVHRLLAALLAVLLLCPMAACIKQEADIGQWEAEEKERVYSSLTSGQYYDLDGRYFYLHDTGLYERPLVICFWKMDRPESLNALPALQKAFERYGDKVQFLMICTYSENDGILLQRLRVEKLPYILFFGKSNELVHIRNEALSEGEIDTLIADILE